MWMDRTTLRSVLSVLLIALSYNFIRVNSMGVKVLGVCGGIGSGKSTASKLLVSDFSHCCMAHIDADKVAHSVYDVGSQSLQDIVNEFGDQVLQDDGQINRPALGGIVFGDAAQMRKLEQIVWPHVQRKVQQQIEEIRQKEGENDKHQIVVVEAAMLLDADWQTFMDGVWVVRASEEAAIQRLVESRGMTDEDAKSRIQAQKHRRGVENLQEEIQQGVVSAVIENSGTLDDLKTALAEKLGDSSSWF